MITAKMEATLRNLLATIDRLTDEIICLDRAKNELETKNTCKRIKSCQADLNVYMYSANLVLPLVKKPSITECTHILNETNKVSKSAMVLSSKLIEKLQNIEEKDVNETLTFYNLVGTITNLDTLVVSISTKYKKYLESHTEELRKLTSEINEKLGLNIQV